MPRIRTIKPEFTQHEELSALPAETHLLAAGLLCYADDEGYFNANPRLIQAAVFPLRELSGTIHGMLTELSHIKFVVLFTGSDGKAYGLIANFRQHQVVNRPYPSKIKAFHEDSVSPHGILMEHSGLKGKEIEGKGREEEPPDFNATEAAMYVGHELNLTGVRGREEIRGAIELRREKTGLTPRGVAEAMVEAWRQFAGTDSAPLTREHSVGKLKFLTEGWWLERHRWPALANGHKSTPANGFLDIDELKRRKGASDVPHH